MKHCGAFALIVFALINEIAAGKTKTPMLLSNAHCFMPISQREVK